MDPRRKSEIVAVILMASAAFLFLSILTFSPTDIQIYTSEPGASVSNLAGVFGSYVGFFFRFIAGAGSYVFPLVLFLWGVSRIIQHEPRKPIFKVTGAVTLTIGISTALSMIFDTTRQDVFDKGGLIGTVVSDFLLKYLGEGGSFLFVSTLVVLSALIATEFMLLPLLSRIVELFKRTGVFFRKISLAPAKSSNSSGGAARSSSSRYNSQIQDKLKQMRKQVEDVRRTSLVGKKNSNKPKRKKNSPKIIKSENKKNTRQKTRSRSSSPGSVSKMPSGGETHYTLPPLDILRQENTSSRTVKDSDLKKRSLLLEKTLLEFGVEANVVKINRGPVITMYELEPALGTKVNKITSLSDNISLAMKSANIRIVAPIPGKGTIGVEVPNQKKELVVLRSVLESDEYQQEDSPLKFGLGKDLSGNPIVVDLASMPHMLIAGATGSGKTVCINTVISILLFNASPKDLKLLLVDPKRVELMIFDGIPHLVCPIVTKAKNASLLLNWVVDEMDRRYKIFSKKGVRNIIAYKNNQNDEDENLPYMVLVVDELADLMMVGKQDVEESIMRIAQLSRAAGIHMILATQRPSVNVITGVIKANFPARISFKVASKVDSRTVLDANGAEKLLGKGDMLLMQPGDSSLLRGQCSLVDDGEIRRIVKHAKAQSSPNYNDEVIEKQKNKASSKNEERDDRYDEAVKLVLETGQASVSMVQRRLRVGYTRAARMIDSMEFDGIVGPYNGSKPREIIVESIEDVEGIE